MLAWKHLVRNKIRIMRYNCFGWLIWPISDKTIIRNENCIKMLFFVQLSDSLKNRKQNLLNNWKNNINLYDCMIFPLLEKGNIVLNSYNFTYFFILKWCCINLQCLLTSIGDNFATFCHSHISFKSKHTYNNDSELHFFLSRATIYNIAFTNA